MGVQSGSPKDPRSSRASADDFPAVLDATDAKLLELVQTDGRITISELGRRVAMSPAAVTERIRRLEDGGVITGWRADVSLARLGYGIVAFVRLMQHDSVRFRDPGLTALLERRTEVLEAHHLLGEADWMFKVAARDTAHLEEVLEELAKFGRLATSPVMSSPVERRAVAPYVTRN